MFQYQAQWADLLAMTVTPCLEDADAGAVMASLGKRWHSGCGTIADARNAIKDAAYLAGIGDRGPETHTLVARRERATCVSISEFVTHAGQ